MGPRIGKHRLVRLSCTVAIEVNEVLSPVVTGLGLGIALAGAPGPVQAVLLTEALRGGPGRGFRAMAGANLTLGALLVALALGLSLVVPSDAILRILKIVGGLYLLYVAADAIRARDDSVSEGARRDLPPVARGALAVVLNPPAWLFLATAASSLMAAATAAGGTRTALFAALALLAGVAAGDGTLVLAGGLGLRRIRAGTIDVGRQLRRALAILLALFAVGLIVSGILQ